MVQVTLDIPDQVGYTTSMIKNTTTPPNPTLTLQERSMMNRDFVVADTIRLQINDLFAQEKPDMDAIQSLMNTVDKDLLNGYKHNGMMPAWYDNISNIILGL